MALTVQELCKLTEPQLTPVAGKSRLSNAVSWVVSTEHVEPKSWLRGGEFLLMCGWNLRASKSAYERYVRHLKDCNVAGLGFGVGMRFKKIPNAIISAAERHELPLCEVPYELSFRDVAQRAAELIFDDQQSHLSISDRFHSNYVREIMEGQIDLHDLATHISHTLLCDAYFKNGQTQIVAKSLHYDANKAEPIFEDSRTSLPVIENYSIELACQKDSLSRANKIFLSEMIFAASVYCYREIGVRQERLRLESDFIHDLSTDTLSTEQITSKLSAFGLDPSNKFTAIVVRDLTYSNDLNADTNSILHKLKVNYISSQNGPSTEVLIGSSGTVSVNAILQNMADAFPLATIGLGKTLPINQLSSTIQQARYLSRAAIQGIVRPETLGINELLMTINNQAAHDFVAGNLGNEIDDKLIEGIEMLLDCGFNLNLAANKLHVHRHTLRYKIEKFIDTTGKNIKDPVVRQSVWMAIKIYRNTQGLR